MPSRERTKLAKGFILNKMYTLRYMGGKHNSPDNLPKSCPPELEQFVKLAIEELRKENLLVIKPTNYGDQATAVMAGVGRDYANAYRRHVNLPETDFNPTKKVKLPPLTKEELRKLKIRK
jgi:hypothetical protein